jgi:hypothetical protein
MPTAASFQQAQQELSQARINQEVTTLSYLTPYIRDMVALCNAAVTVDSVGVVVLVSIVSKARVLHALSWLHLRPSPLAARVVR